MKRKRLQINVNIHIRRARMLPLLENIIYVLNELLLIGQK